MVFVMKGFDASLEPPSSSDVSAHVVVFLCGAVSLTVHTGCTHPHIQPNSPSSSIDFPAVPEPTAQMKCCQTACIILVLTMCPPGLTGHSTLGKRMAMGQVGALATTVSKTRGSAPARLLSQPFGLARSVPRWPPSLAALDSHQTPTPSVYLMSQLPKQGGTSLLCDHADVTPD